MYEEMENSCYRLYRDSGSCWDYGGLLSVISLILGIGQKVSLREPYGTHQVIFPELQCNPHPWFLLFHHKSLFDIHLKTFAAASNKIYFAAYPGLPDKAET